tara:strand:- start:47 stop:721 length:675 start_codon:yes stop_codon:yes gene_type:complete
MKKIIILLVLATFLTSCQKNIFTNIAKTDIDIVSEIHVINAKGYIEELIIKLYKLNPIYIQKNNKFNKISEVIIDIFKETDISKIDKSGKENIDYILKGFEKSFNGDRVYFISKGLYGMINASYNYKDKFYLTDPKLSSEKLMNTAINIETLVWRLSNTKKNGEILIKTNNIEDDKINLSFERLFGKLINNQENMARIISSQEGRAVQKAAKRIVSTIFLPIGF